MIRPPRAGTCILIIAAAITVTSCGPQHLPASTGIVTTTSTSTTTTTTTTTPVTTEPISGSSTTTTLADQSATAPRIEWQGADDFLLGANLPWYNFGCDFGCRQGARGGQGMSAPAVSDTVAAAIEPAAAAGMKVVRWWLFPGEPWQITVGLDGLPVGIDEAVYPDIDAALALADQLDISYVFTIFSAPSEIPDPWLTRADGRSRLAEALGELFRHYQDDPRIMTWQIINEPEWDIWNDVVALEDVQDLVARITATIHENTTALASVPSANLTGLEFWRDSGLDYYTAHWYDPMSEGLACAICTNYAEVAARLDIDAPIVIGEFYGGFDTELDSRLEDFYTRGYAGAWAWSLLPDRTADKLQIDLDAAAAFVERHRSDTTG